MKLNVKHRFIPRLYAHQAIMTNSQRINEWAFKCFIIFADIVNTPRNATLDASIDEQIPRVHNRAAIAIEAAAAEKMSWIVT